MLVGSAFRFTFGTLTIGGRVILIACSMTATIDNLLTTFKKTSFFLYFRTSLRIQASKGYLLLPHMHISLAVGPDISAATGC